MNVVELTNDQHFNLMMLHGAKAIGKEKAIPAEGKGVCLYVSVVDELIKMKLASKDVEGVGDSQITKYWLTEAGAERAQFPAKYVPAVNTRKTPKK